MLKKGSTFYLQKDLKKYSRIWTLSNHKRHRLWPRYHKKTIFKIIGNFSENAEIPVKSPILQILEALLFFVFLFCFMFFFFCLFF